MWVLQGCSIECPLCQELVPLPDDLGALDGTIAKWPTKPQRWAFQMLSIFPDDEPLSGLHFLCVWFGLF